MKKWLMAGAISIALAQPAAAQVAVIDGAALLKMAEELGQLKATYDATMGVLGSLQRELDPNTLARGLMNNVLPGSSDVGSAITGSGGMLGGLNGLLSTYKDRNTYYRPEGDDFGADQMDRAGTSYSGVQAMAERQMQAIADRLDGIQEIQDQLSSASSDADINAIQARLDAEHAKLSGNMAQTTAISNLLAAQQAQFGLRQAQKGRKDADDLLTWSKQGATGADQPTGSLVSNANPDLPAFRSVEFQ